MKYYIAVYQKLREIYQARGAMENDVPMICPSLRMYENQDLALLKPFPLLDDQQKKTESILRKQNISYELNSVPVSPYFWDLNVNTALFDIYRDILQNSNIRNFEQSLKKISTAKSTLLFDKDNEETPEFALYRERRQAYEEVLESIAEHLNSFDESETEDQKNLWKDKLLLLNTTKQESLAIWITAGNKDLIENELRRINATSEADFYVTLTQDAKFTFDAAEQTDITSNSSIHDINFIPFDFMENESGWNNLILNKEELENLYNTAKNSNENLPAEILTIDYDEKGIAGIEVDYSFVHLKRSWFAKSVLLSPYFMWPESRPISDGSTISENFKLPAFPKVMMLIKNLKINLDPTVEAPEINSPEKLVFFGPLIMKQQLFINQNTKQHFLKAVTDKQTLKSDQMSYLAAKTAPQHLRFEKRNRPRVFENVGGDPIKIPTTVKFDRMNMGKVFTAQPGLAATVQPASTHATTSAAATVNPTLIVDKKVMSGIFLPINLPPAQHLANVTFRVNDQQNGEPVYKCSISILGNNSNAESNRIFSIETDKNGTISQNIPVGDYKITLRADEYALLDGTLSIGNTAPLLQQYKLQRQEIKFKTFFLIGMVCEKMPKIPIA